MNGPLLLLGFLSLPHFTSKKILLCSWHWQVPEACLIKPDQLFDSEMKYTAESGLRKLNPRGPQHRTSGCMADNWNGPEMSIYTWKRTSVYVPHLDSATFISYYQNKLTIIKNTKEQNIYDKSTLSWVELPSTRLTLYFQTLMPTVKFSPYYPRAPSCFTSMWPRLPKSL